MTPDEPRHPRPLRPMPNGKEEKLLKVEVEISMIDEKIATLKTTEHDLHPNRPGGDTSVA